MMKSSINQDLDVISPKNKDISHHQADRHRRIQSTQIDSNALNAEAPLDTLADALGKRASFQQKGITLPTDDFPPGPISPSNPNVQIDQISPELAALIVKKYILPMFESDGKKLMKGSSSQALG